MENVKREATAFINEAGEWLDEAWKTTKIVAKSLWNNLDVSAGVGQGLSF